MSEEQEDSKISCGPNLWITICGQRLEDSGDKMWEGTNKNKQKEENSYR